MLKTIATITLVLALALGGGAASAWWMLEATRAVGSVSIGEWTAFPNAGTRKADPYSHARSARLGNLVLGQAEGIAFVADRDRTGAPLLRQCSYRIEGSVPPVRFFTLYAATADGRVLRSNHQAAAALHSQSLLWLGGKPLAMIASPQSQPGNWLPTAGSGSMRLVLTLFDTPISTSARVGEIQLPRITKVGCDA